MDFTHLNLKKYLTETNSTPDSNLATAAERKSATQATNSSDKQHSTVSRSDQLKHRSARTGHTSLAPTVDISPSAGPTASPVATAESFINQRNAIERRKLIEKSKVDWRKEIMEAVNPDDEPDHPYVEIMPYFKYKEKEAKWNTAKAAAKDRAATGERAVSAPVNEESFKDKKDSGKAIPKAKGARNADNTATPRENVARRKANRVPDKSMAQKKLIEPMTNDAIADN